MNAQTASSKFATLNMAKVPSDLKREITEIQKATNNFTDNSATASEWYQNFGILYGYAKGVPGAISSTSGPAKKSTAKAAKSKTARRSASPKAKSASGTKKTSAAKPKTTAKPKAKTKPAAKRTTRKKAVKPGMSTAAKQAAATRKLNLRKKERIKEYTKKANELRKLAKVDSRLMTRINTMVSDHMKKYGLAGDKLDRDLERAKKRYMLYKRFVSSDTRAFKTIKKKTGGSLEGPPKHNYKLVFQARPDKGKWVDKRVFAADSSYQVGTMAEATIDRMKREYKQDLPKWETRVIKRKVSNAKKKPSIAGPKKPVSKKKAPAKKKGLFSRLFS